jgi:hypothetical protein
MSLEKRTKQDRLRQLFGLARQDLRAARHARLSARENDPALEDLESFLRIAETSWQTRPEGRAANGTA